MAQETRDGGLLREAPGKEKTGKKVYLVYVEWQNSEAEILAVFTGKGAEKRAERYAEEKRHEYAEGKYTERRYSVWGHEGNDDPDWDVDVHVEEVETNPRIPDVYRRLRQRRRTKEARRAKAGKPMRRRGL